MIVHLHDEVRIITNPNKAKLQYTRSSFLEITNMLQMAQGLDTSPLSHLPRLLWPWFH
jgi:hypothetical protein